VLTELVLGIIENKEAMQEYLVFNVSLYAAIPIDDNSAGGED